MDSFAPDLAFAMNRFGLGPHADAPMPQMDPQAWVNAQLSRSLEIPSGLPAAASVAAMVQAIRAATESMKSGSGTKQAFDDARARQVNLLIDLVGTRTNLALSSDTPFLERMTHFWGNHFAVSANGIDRIGFVGLHELAYLRPHVTGRFADLLMASTTSPAMLLYLDQAMSIGPNSAWGRRSAANDKDRGLNENLAREILELHTMGVRSGYGQDDVLELARALTGYTVGGVGKPHINRLVGGEDGAFLFKPDFHEPGTRVLLGKSYPDTGAAQARAMLDDLARRPETARFIATKLARHFTGDTPPPAMVAALERVFLDTDGDLKSLYAALIDSPHSWLGGKFRSPWDWTIAAMRGLGMRDVAPRTAFQLFRQMGMPVWQPASPAGYGDTDADWTGSAALLKRIELAQRFADRSGEKRDARALAPHLMGNRLGEHSRFEIARAESRTTGLALMLACPEMLRR